MGETLKIVYSPVLSDRESLYADEEETGSGEITILSKGRFGALYCR